VLFKPPDFFECQMPEPLDVHGRDRAAHLSGEQQQRTGSLDERVQADTQQLACVVGNRF
jgi:hypothetical protein